MFTFSLVFVLLLVVSCLFCVVATNPIHNVSLLIVSFFLVALLLINFGLEFIALVLVIVYVGAVAILFLFVVMILNINLVDYDDFYNSFFFLAVCVFFLAMVLPILLYVYDLFDSSVFFVLTEWSRFLDAVDADMFFLGQIIFMYDVSIVFCSLLLLVAMLGSISLTLYELFP